MSRDEVEAEITLDEVGLVAGGRATLRFRTTARAPVKVRGAHARFVGFEETKAVYTTSDGKTTTTHTATERNALVEVSETFLGRPPAGFFHNLADGAMTLLGGGDHEILEPGNHDLTLDVDLPADLPATFEAEKAKIGYEASIHLDIPAGRDFRHTVAFEVEPAGVPERPLAEPLALRYPEDAGRGFFDSLFGPDVKMRVHLHATVVRRGDTLTGELEVRSREKPLKADAVVCRLLRRERSEAHEHEDRHAEELAVERNSQDDPTSTRLAVPFAVRVPDDIIPGCSGAKFTLSHELAVSLDVPWAKDPTIRIPVTIV